MEATKSNPAPLDAYETAKPDEPIFVLQGGDPLAAPLVRIWAYLARVRAGLSGDATMIDAPIFVAKTTNVEHDSAAVNDLLVRATAAEQISWHMDGYRRGEITHESEVRSVSDLEKLDIYDIRRRFASALSNYRCSILEYKEELEKRNFMNEEIEQAIAKAEMGLEAAMAMVEIRR